MVSITKYVYFINWIESQLLLKLAATGNGCRLPVHANTGRCQHFQRDLVSVRRKPRFLIQGQPRRAFIIRQVRRANKTWPCFRGDRWFMQETTLKHGHVLELQYCVCITNTSLRVHAFVGISQRRIIITNTNIQYYNYSIISATYVSNNLRFYFKKSCVERVSSKTVSVRWYFYKQRLLYVAGMAVSVGVWMDRGAYRHAGVWVGKLWGRSCLWERGCLCEHGRVQERTKDMF